MTFHTQRTSLNDEITMSHRSIDLNTNSVHSAYLLECTITAKNNGSAAKTPTITEFLNMIENISVVTDNHRYHYSWSSLDIARRNAMKQAMGTHNCIIDMTFTSAAAGADMTASFVLLMDEGDVVALLHDSVSMSAQFAANLAENCPVTAVSIKPTIDELIPMSGLADVKARYGAKYHGALEPKVGITVKECSSNNTLTEFLDLPNSTLLVGVMLNWTTKPLHYSVIANVPARTELMRLNWKTAVATDEMRFGVNMPENTNYIDFNTELTSNGLGIDGRNFNRGDYKIAAYAPTGTIVICVSFEQLYPPKVEDGTLVTNHSIY